MKKIFDLFTGVALLAMTACSGEDKLPPLPRPVDIVMSVADDNLAGGDELEIVFAVEEEGVVANEAFPIRLYLEEGGTDAGDLFVNFPSSVDFPVGESEMKVTVPVDMSLSRGIHDVTLSAFSRGYRISGTPKPIRVSDRHYVAVAVKNNAGNSVREGDNFILAASADGKAVEEDVTLSVRCLCEGGDCIADLPESIMLKAGELSAETGFIRMKSDGGIFKDVDLVLEFTSSSDKHPVWPEKLVIERVDIDKPLGDPLTDERHLYAMPSLAYVSAGNAAEVENWGGQTAVEVTAGVTVHPTQPGWIFHNAVEFHYIQSMLYNNNTLGKPNAAGGQDRPHSFWDQTTPKAGQYMTVNNDRYSSITPSGYMRMWAARDASMAKGYGVSALYSNKFKSPSGPNSNTAKPMYCHILPGCRVEFRMRVAGELYGFSPAIWMLGNSNIQPSGSVAWPACGEVDIVEIPVGPVTGKAPWQSLHFGNSLQDGTDVYAPTTGALKTVDVTGWNIYWIEWTDENTVRLGINGQTNLTATRDKVEAEGGVWPFDLNANPYGLHLVMTLGYPAPSTWALGYSGTPPEGWDKGFSSVSYPESRSSDKTPRMEVDWIRYYVSAVYPSVMPTASNNSKFY